jgi:hypothetical protein
MLTAIIIGAIIWVGSRIAAEDEDTRRMRNLTNGYQQRRWGRGEDE